MYLVTFHRNYEVDPTDRLDVGTFPTIDEAKAARRVSGDLVCYSDTGEVVIDDAWLWDWEVADPDCYAQRMMRVR